MKLMVGIEDFTSESDIEELVRAGTDEFFTGIIPKEWAGIYGYQVSLNRREWSPNQFHSFEKLRVIADTIHSLGKKIAVAFNAPDYYAGQLPYIKKYFHKLKELRIDALIIADLSLLFMLKEWELEFDIYMSGTAGAYNSRAVKHYAHLGVKRILFPRDMTLDEMKNVIENTSHSGIEYEAFMMGERCPFTESYCRTTHGFASILFCHHLWGKSPYLRLQFGFYKIYEKEGNKNIVDYISRPSIDLIKKWNYNSAQYKGWASGGLAMTLNFFDMAVEECGLCAIPVLAAIGVHSLKIVGRSRPVKTKLVRVRLVKNILDNIKLGSAYAKELRNNPDLCALGYKCYYPEARNR